MGPRRFPEFINKLANVADKPGLLSQIRPMPEELLNEARRLGQAGRIAEAAEFYARVLRADPRNFEAHHALGMIFLQNGGFDQAQILLAEAVRLDPLSLDSHYACGIAQLHLGRHREALASFDAALALRPGFVGALSNRGTALLGLNAFDEALAGFDAVFAIDPEHAVSWSNRGNALLAMRRFEEAVASYDRALAIRPDFPEARDNRTYALGVIAFQNGQFEEAQRILDEAVRLNPSLLDGLCIRGIALMRLGRREEALACFDRALAAKPDFVEALTNRATALLELKRFDEALAGFDAALGIDPRHAVAWNNRGNTQTALKQFQDAIASYDRALAIQPDFPEARDNRATALFALGRLSRCPPAYMRALFDDYSSYYDASMVGALGYRGHLHLRNLAERVLPRLTPPWRILDLGCGTGLVGTAFADLAQGGRLDGVDLSPRMIEAARARGIYDELILGDLEIFLTTLGTGYDLILAADTMVYFGDLAPTFAGVVQQLQPGGFYLFAVEAKAGQGWEQTPLNRFRHSEDYLRTQAARAGLTFVDIMECLLRREQNEPVNGLAVALQKPADS
jgi:predicted TPR repeat methyltransferase